ncbi:hypothetical protein AKO1_008660, partial [Acrasis kona]
DDIIAEVKEANQQLIDHFFNNVNTTTLSPSHVLNSIINQSKLFINAIDWSDQFLHALFAFHIVFLTIAVLTRKSQSIQAGLFIIILGIVYAAEAINKWGDQNWKTFSSQNYFDESGTFVTVLLSVPLLLIAVFMLCNLLFTTCNLMVAVKRKQIIRQRKAQQEAKN